MPADWLILTLAAILIFSGLPLLAWALFADRARGRKRCPKCWYSMEGATSLLCPECGHEAASPGHLLRTRRRRKPAAAAIAALLIGVGLITWSTLENDQRVRHHGWGALVPATVLVVLFSVTEREWIIDGLQYHVQHDASGNPIGGSYWHHRRHAMWPWQWRRLGNIALRRIENDNPHWEVRISYIHFLKEAAMYADDARFRRRAIEAIANNFEHDNDRVRSAALIYSIDYHDIDASIARILPMLEHEHERTRTAAVTALGGVATLAWSTKSDAPLRDALSHECPHTRRLAAAFVGFAARSGIILHEAKRELHRLDDDPDDDFREWRIRSLVRALPLDEASAILESAWDGGDPAERRGAFSSLEDLSHRTTLDQALVSRMAIEALETDDPDVHQSAVEFVRDHMLPVDLEPYADHLETLLEHDNPAVRHAASIALSRLNR